MLSVTATDGADNKTTERYTIVGIPKPDVKAQTTQTAVSGDPVGVRLEYGPNLKIKQVATTLNGQPVPTFWNQTGAAAFGGVPLGSETSTLPLDISLTDEFNRVTTLSRTVAVTADPRGTELLNLSPEVLSSSTPENRALEETTLDAAYAKDAPYPEWRRPFMLPVDGITTSSFGASRQYGPGGNISYHQGADLAAPEGTPVHATNAGTVRVAGFYPIKGGLVMIDHGGGICQPLLSPVENPRQSRGDRAAGSGDWRGRDDWAVNRAAPALGDARRRTRDESVGVGGESCSLIEHLE